MFRDFKDKLLIFYVRRPLLSYTGSHVPQLGDEVVTCLAD